MLHDLLMHCYFRHDCLVSDYSLSAEIEDYYDQTKKMASDIPDTKGIKQNRLYEMVIRNLLILGENIYRGRRIIELDYVDISLRAVYLLCKRQIRKLFRMEGQEFDWKDIEEMIEYAHTCGGLPIQYTKLIDDPKEKGKIKHLFFGVPQIQTNIEIRLCDCNCAYIFYAMLLTALVINMEVTC